jgi:hypothetical protein
MQRLVLFPKLLTLSVLLIALTSTVFPASAPQAASIKDIFEKYDLLGTFAWDCSRPSSANNWYYVNRLLDADHVQRDLMTGPTTRQWVTVLDKASELKLNEVMVSGWITGALEGSAVENEPVDGVWRIERNRMQQWTSTFQANPSSWTAGCTAATCRGSSSAARHLRMSRPR